LLVDVISGVPTAGDIDRQLHGERIIQGTHRRRLHKRNWVEVPWGAFVMTECGPALALDDVIVPWTIHGYIAGRAPPAVG
jgi:hypothetical protein